jgi:hypothetical protein
MYYEINVSFTGRHLFATAKRSIRDLEACKRVLHLLVQKFPSEAGYRISVTRYVDAGTILDVDKLLEG